MTENRVSMREVVKRMDDTVQAAVSGEKTVSVASMTIGELNSMIRLAELQVQTAKSCGRAVDVPELDFIDFK